MEKGRVEVQNSYSYRSWSLCEFSIMKVALRAGYYRQCATRFLASIKVHSGWLVVFYVPTTARSFRDGTPIYCPLRRT